MTKNKKPKIFNDAARAKWLKSKYEIAKKMIDLFSPYDPRVFEAKETFKRITKVNYEDAEDTIKNLYASHFGNKRRELDIKLKPHKPELFEDY
jgi:hypothetical protein